MEKISVSVELPVQKDALFHAWLDSAEHSLFTGSHAEIDAVIGGRFSAWEGYITGKTLEMDSPNRIVQSWRTIEFNDTDANSKLEIILESTEKGTLMTLIHTDIPDGQGEMYREGWEEYYFRPMLDYFCK
jgi:activator of HSP90 ATPase